MLDDPGSLASYLKKRVMEPLDITKALLLNGGVCVSKPTFGFVVLLLCCVVLCCVVLCCMVLCCVILFCCVVLCCIVLCCVVLFCCVVLCCGVLCCVVLCYFAVRFVQTIPLGRGDPYAANSQICHILLQLFVLTPKRRTTTTPHNSSVR